MVYFTASCDAMDGEKGNAAFAKSMELDYPILSDAAKTAAQAYGLINDQGKGPGRVTFYIGKDGKILAVDRAVKPASAGADLVAKLKDLGVAEKK